MLGGTDCSDGLARCVGGRVEISRAAHVPDPCGGPGESRGEACTCPWDVVGRCDTTCAVEGLEVLARAELARVQLCRSRTQVARPRLPTDPQPRVCAHEGVVCRDGLVEACARAGLPSTVLAVCSYGCQPAVGMVDDVTPGARAIADGAAEILCRRDDAERR
jgi:hypothetical protein